jgi:ferrous iron transport protein A
MDAAVVTTLNQIAVGQRARITKISGDKSLARRLLGLGLRVGSEISLIQHRDKGVVIASSGTRVALGSTVADKLTIQPLN